MLTYEVKEMLPLTLCYVQLTPDRVHNTLETTT